MAIQVKNVSSAGGPQVYKDPIKVICINAKNSKKLIKGATYLATAIRTYNNNNNNTSDRHVYLKDVGSYVTKNFTLFDGRSLDNQPDFNVQHRSSLNCTSKNYTGQFVKCRYSSGKSMKEGEIYYVEEQRSVPHTGYNGQIRYETKFKIRGIRNCVNPYRFEEIPITEQRAIKLKNLKGDKIKTGEQTRKFLLYTEKQKINILFETLARTMADLNKIEFDKEINIIDLMITKGRNYNIAKEDVVPFLKNKIETILKPFNLTKKKKKIK
jgi:hypothetical protein